MKVWLMGAACAITLGMFAFTPARADNGCAAALQVFRQADDDFSQADNIKDKSAWERGNAIVAEHHNDLPPAGCDQDEFDLTRLVAMEHGLRTGVAFGTVDGAEAVQAANGLRGTTLYNAQVRRGYMDVQSDLKKRFGDLLYRADEYVSQIGDAYKASIGALKPGAKCAKPYADATAIKPVPPEFPRQARGMRGTFIALIRVTIAANGDLKDAQIAQSTGDASLDRAALEAARASQYTPKVVNCQPVEGTYLYRATFSTN